MADPIEYMDTEVVEAPKNLGGRPYIFKTPEDMQIAIDNYFNACNGKQLLNNSGMPVLNKYGQPVYLDQKPPTITGLALALGFNSRQALLNYQSRDGFNDTVTRAKAYIEQYVEGRLFDKDGCNGAKFSLINNFKGWKEEPNNVIMLQNNFQLPQLQADIKQLEDKLKSLESHKPVALQGMEKDGIERNNDFVESQDTGTDHKPETISTS